MSANKTETKSATPAATVPQPQALPQPKGQEKHPKAIAAPLGRRSNVVVVCEPGVTYRIAVAHGEGVVKLPFRLPAGAKTCAVKICGTNNNWIGQNGRTLCVYVCPAPDASGMGVTLQPTEAGYVAHPYTAGLHVLA